MYITSYVVASYTVSFAGQLFMRVQICSKKANLATFVGTLECSQLHYGCYGNVILSPWHSGWLLTNVTVVYGFIVLWSTNLVSDKDLYSLG